MLKNMVVLVTGGAGLIGREFVKAIAKNGGIAIIGDVSAELSNSVCRELQQLSPESKIDFYELDTTSKSSVNSVIAKIVEKYGKLDALVNCAYPKTKNFGKNFYEVEYKDFCEIINMNLGGYFLMSQQASKLFLEQGYGNIINIASIYGVIPPRFEVYNNTEMSLPAEYAALKAGLIHLTKYMAKLFKSKNIRVNTISPGGIFNNQEKPFLAAYKNLSMNKGMLDNSDIAGTLVYLLSDMSKYVNGQNIVVDDGFSL